MPCVSPSGSYAKPFSIAASWPTSSSKRVDNSFQAAGKRGHFLSNAFRTSFFSEADRDSNKTNTLYAPGPISPLRSRRKQSSAVLVVKNPPRGKFIYLAVLLLGSRSVANQKVCPGSVIERIRPCGRQLMSLRESGERVIVPPCSTCPPACLMQAHCRIRHVANSQDLVVDFARYSPQILRAQLAPIGIAEYQALLRIARRVTRACHGSGDKHRK